MRGEAIKKRTRPVNIMLLYALVRFLFRYDIGQAEFLLNSFLLLREGMSLIWQC